MMRTTAYSYLDAKCREVRLQRAYKAAHGAELAKLRRRALAMPASAPFARAMRDGDFVTLVAEFKRASPSAGRIIAHESPDSVVRNYANHGARAVSVLTDMHDFGGSLRDLELAVHAVSVPVLRKDFIVDRAGLYESRSAGASAALLIVAVLDQLELADLLRDGAETGLECLVEVHDEAEAERALVAGARLIGINNRNLHSLATDLSTTERVAKLLPLGTTIVSESGIRDADDVMRARDAGAHAVLVGESLLREPAATRGALVRVLSGVPR